MRPKGRRAAIAVGALALATLVAAGAALRKPILERWYLQRLKTEKDWSEPARRLGELRSAEGIVFFLENDSPDLFVDLQTSPSNVGNVSPVRQVDILEPGIGLTAMMDALGPAEFVDLLKRIALDRSREATTRFRVVGILIREEASREASLLLCSRLLTDPEPLLRSAAATGLGALDPFPGALIPELKKALEDPDARVRDAAHAALKKAGMCE